ncbi:MAG: CHAD domain-containing protein [Anaerolineae bacterium]|nr:CHAD domain-containing protein [Anaerolineae bacterium]
MTLSMVIPDLLMVEAGRLLMANELAIVQTYWPDLRLSTEARAVHETRKAIRRTFTLFKLFAPFFAGGELDPHRRGLRKIMRRLAPCRDTTVFRMKLAIYNETAERSLTELAGDWDTKQIAADDALRQYLARPSVAAVLERYAQLTGTAGSGLPAASDNAAPIRVRHALPAMVFQRLGTVQAYGDLLPDATEDQLHQLRIQFKELRYTLSFFKEVLGEAGNAFIEVSRSMQDFLGDLNDARVAVDLMAKTEEHREEAAIYGAFQQSRLEELMAEAPERYADFDQPALRLELATALATL